MRSKGNHPAVTGGQTGKASRVLFVLPSIDASAVNLLGLQILVMPSGGGAISRDEPAVQVSSQPCQSVSDQELLDLMQRVAAGGADGGPGAL